MRKKQTLEQAFNERILVMDGAMGTMIQAHEFNEEDFRGNRFASHSSPLQGCNDVLVLTQPNAIQEIHEAYLEVGADMVETNTFNANSLSMAEYELEDYVFEMNVQAAALARRLRAHRHVPQ